MTNDPIAVPVYRDAFKLTFDYGLGVTRCIITNENGERLGYFYLNGLLDVLLLHTALHRILSEWYGENPHKKDDGE